MGKVTPTPVRRCCPPPGYMSDVDAVHDVVQHIDELGRHRGYGQLQHEADGRGSKLLLVFMGLAKKLTPCQKYSSV